VYFLFHDRNQLLVTLGSQNLKHTLVRVLKVLFNSTHHLDMALVRVFFFLEPF
jgi:hypothetical protein